ncbi:hypothetical protein ENSA5_25710 [Enhygromyxa salina]|uniref:Uncharacterized protein n=1 Tax=Enhygromyxa salina TaxID=215803 RepID=A0A2S9YAN0_9BACT|nr:hypothetical protein [Enhygromyxa salina]PRQ02112.1 hypothetical protein ENSA5_25710 [Enhygromyxa salina]
MFEILRSIPLALALALVCGSCDRSGSGDSVGDGEDQIALCQKICIKPFCDPTLEPTEDAEQGCRVTCEERVEDASHYDCSDAYQELLECLDRLTCDEFYQWAAEEEGAPCAAEEALLTDRCPELTIRTGA